MNNDNIKQILAPVDYFCAATNFEQFCLWKEHQENLNWIDESSDVIFQIGLINDDVDRVIVVALSFATIENKVICFFNVVSRYNDKEVVANFIKHFATTYNGRLTVTDAQNFSHILNFLNNE